MGCLHTEAELFEMADLAFSRLTATKYLEALTAAELLNKRKIGQWNYFINPALTPILTDDLSFPIS